jgi:hypothetical protein
LHEVVRRMRRLMKVVGRGFRHGRLTGVKLRRIEKIVRETAKAIEEVLAD